MQHCLASTLCGTSSEPALHHGPSRASLISGSELHDQNESKGGSRCLEQHQWPHPALCWICIGMSPYRLARHQPVKAINDWRQVKPDSGLPVARNQGHGPRSECCHSKPKMQQRILAGKVRTARIVRGWIQGELTQRCEISKRTISNLEAGSVSVQLEFLLKVLWTVDLINDFIRQIKSVGLNDHEFKLLEATQPLRVREKGRNGNV